MRPLPTLIGLAAVSLLAAFLWHRRPRSPRGGTAEPPGPRWIGLSLVLFAIGAFVLGLLNLLTDERPSIGWGFAIPIAAFASVGGISLLKMTPGPLSPELAEMAATLSPPPSSLPAPPPGREPGGDDRSFPRSMASAHLFVWILELALGIPFLVIGVRNPETRLIVPGALLALLGVVFFVIWRRTVAKARLRTSGVRGEGQIVGLTQTGMTVNNNPVVGLDLVVSVPGASPYLVRTREVVPLVAVGRLTAGRALELKADPANPTRVLIEW